MSLEQRRKLLELLVRGTGGASRPVTPPAEPRIERASHAQRRLWFLEQVQRDRVPYTIHAVRPVNWAVDPALLLRAVNDIIERHEILRTTFALEKGEPMQHISERVRIPLPVEDLRSVPESERRVEAIRRMGEVLARRFDLERGPLVRTILYRMDERAWIFFLSVHHIVYDGASFELFFSELETIYGALTGGRPSPLAPRTVQYADFARSQHAALTPERIEAETEFWRSELADVAMLDLPFDRGRSQVPSFRGAIKRIEIPASVTAELQRRASSKNATLFMVLLAGAASALSRICGQDDFAIGLPVTGRDTPGLQDAIGFFVDTVVVRCRLDDDPTTDELIERTRDAVNRSLAHRVLPFEMLVEHLRPVRDLGVNPFFQVGFQLKQDQEGPHDPEAFDIQTSSAMFDLGLDLWLEGEALGGRIQFNTDLFDPPTVDLIVTALQSALSGLLDPGRHLSEIAIAPDDQSGSYAAGEQIDFDKRSFGELLEDLARRHPDAIAIEAFGAGMSYGELIHRVAALGTALRLRGVGSESLVALAVPRSLELVCLQLATWRAGGAFVCLDPEWPDARRESVLRDARPTLTVDTAEATALFQEATVVTAAGVWAGGSAVAYVIFTSGSTGVPKGVVLEHAGLLNVAMTQRQVFGLGPGRRVAQLAAPTFDASIFESVLALGSGATLVVAPPGPLVGDELAEFLHEDDVDTIVIPPSLLATVRPSAGDGLRLICVAGESCSVDLSERWARGREFWNLYGPTEATIWATFGHGRTGNKVPIGRPIPNMSVSVVDRAMRPVPRGVAGELCLSGVGIGRGYLNRPDVTNQRFVADPTNPSRRIYRTGDLVRQLRSGDLVFLGRVDRQVKVRGFRIEPEEIETALRRHPSVSDVIVVSRCDEGRDSRLVAYLQSADETGDLVDECRRLLEAQLPHYMVPSGFVVLSGLPRSSSGKVDHRALPPPSDLLMPTGGHVEPSTPTERRVAEMMARAARVPRVGASDDFFRIGGHSLSAAQLVSDARAAFGVDISIQDVFLHPAVSALAGRLDALVRDRGASAEDLDVPLVRLPRNHEVEHS